MDSYLPELSSRMLDGFLVTLRILGWSMLFSGVIGTVLASMRVSPVAPLRAVGTSYVNVFRNTPLVVLFVIATEGFPTLGIRISFVWFAILTLTLYTSSFVCEAVRSGINTVDVGQAEAARSIGLGFGQTLRSVVLPQAVRSSIPPLASVFIALTKNTAVAAGFGVIEATGQLSNLVRDFPNYLYASFFAIALGYVVIVFVISAIAAVLERRLVVVR
jgi:glutamate transport system permease protein